MSGIIDPDARINLILGSGLKGLSSLLAGQTLGFAVNGIEHNGANLNENQHERTDFAIISLQKHVHDIDAQISAYALQARLLTVS